MLTGPVDWPLHEGLVAGGGDWGLGGGGEGGTGGAGGGGDAGGAGGVGRPTTDRMCPSGTPSNGNRMAMVSFLGARYDTVKAI